MVLAKRDIIAAIEETPDDADLGELLYSLYVRYEVGLSEKEFQETGKTLSQDEVRALVDSWQK